MVICNKKSPKAKLWGTVGLVTVGEEGDGGRYDNKKSPHKRGILLVG